MSRTHGLVALVFSGAFVALCCTGPNNAGSETAVLALGGAGASPDAGMSCGMAGHADTPAVRGYVRSDGVREVVFRATDTTDIYTWTGGAVHFLAGGAKAGTNAWGYKRHDGPDIRLYIDQNGHIHEFGSGDTDFNTCCGINAPIAASRDVIGYVRSDGKSGLVYRSDLDRVVEITSNFSGSPPWLAIDLTQRAIAHVAATANPFPYVRADGHSAIVYVGSDNHIHELSNTGRTGWSDIDLHVASQETILARAGTSPWGYKLADGTSSVLWVGQDSKLRQFVATSNWTSVILPGVGPVVGIRPSGYVAPNGVNAVVYISAAPTAFLTLHQLTQSGTTWTDEQFPDGSCVRPASEPFAQQLPGNVSSVLFLGNSPMGVQRYEFTKPAGGSWTLATF